MSYEGLMPALPLPKLEDSIDSVRLHIKCKSNTKCMLCFQYLHSVKHVLAAEEYSHVCIMADTFRNNEGPRLQRLLWLIACVKSNWVML
jgi:hypothetical protein